MGTSLTILAEDDWHHWRALRLAALAESPEAFGATLADWSGEGDKEERWRGRLRAVPFNVIAHVDGEPAGMVSGTSPDETGTVELLSMWVAPSVRRRGVGAALVDEVIRWAREQGAEHVRLAVREINQPARALYEERGFVDAGVSEESDPATPERLMVRRMSD